ncbi:MAG: flap endonuclease-1 [archaeon]|nr:flap endonuclease-1 [archaeon]
MGTAIGELVKKHEIGLDDLSGKVVGVDAFNTLYQFLSIIRGPDGTPLMDRKGEITSHLTGLLYRTTNLLQKGIKPVFVFDGKPHELKAQTSAKRREIRTQAQEKFLKAKEEGKDEEARKFAQQAVFLNEKMINEAKELIQLLGLPVIQAPSDGEAQIAKMCEQGKVEACISQDFDSLLFGTPILVRNLAVTGKRKLPGRNIYIDVSPERIELQETLTELGITREKLIWIGILIGTDFNEKFPKIGAKTALKYVKKFDSFEEIIKESKFEPQFDYKQVESIFLNPKAINDYTLEFSQMQSQKILDLLVGKHDFSEERVKNTLKKLGEKIDEQQTKGNQQNLKQWFG